MQARGFTRILAAGAITALVAGGVRSAAAQVNKGGKGGGLPGHGPSGQGGKPTTSTGGTPLPDDLLVYHVLDRLTYGHTDADIEAIRQMGLDSWIRWQLQPGQIPENPTLTAKLAALPPAYTATGDPSWDWNNLYQDYLLRARFTSRQLNEVMTEFWSNHFDTGLQIGGSNKVGYYSSHAFDGAGGAGIAYYDLYANRAYYAYWNGSIWTQTPIENVRGTGSFTSLAIDPTTGQPGVSYYDARGTSLNLRFARFNGTTWTPEAVDTTGDVGQWTSLEFTSTGRPVIAYYDVTNRDLKLATGPGPAWTIQTVDSAGDVGQFASLALNAADEARIAYYDATTGSLRYAEQNGAGFTIQTVDAGPGAGLWCSIAVNPASGLAAISYHDAASQELKYAESRGAGWRAPVVVDTTGNDGQYSSLVFTAAGVPRIAYYEDAPTYDLKYAEFTGGVWNVQGVDVDGARPAIAGEWASLAIDPTGNPSISYHNGSQFTLRRAYWNGTAWTRQTAYNPGQTNFIYTIYEKEETEAFRQGALGRFRQLLDISANSPAMMIFLDNYQNTASNGNENYGRELLELHTLGVDAGYTQTDVETISRAFTGWGVIPPSTRCDVRAGAFCYNHLAHDGTAKSVFGIGLPDDSANNAGNWQLQGKIMLDELARHPQTARFLCRKLIQKFVADVPPAGLLGECQAVFLHSDGDIRSVLQTLFFSSEFRSTANYLNKVRTPLEYSVATVRHLEGDTDGGTLYSAISNQGMPLFRNSIPTGWAEEGVEWVGSNSLLQRWKWADQVTHNTFGTTTDPFTLVRNTGVTTADGVVEYFVQKLLRGQAGAVERALLVDCVSNGSPAAFDINDPATPNRVRDTVDMMLGFPIYQKQ